MGDTQAERRGGGRRWLQHTDARPRTGASRGRGERGRAEVRQENWTAVWRAGQNSEVRVRGTEEPKEHCAHGRQHRQATDRKRGDGFTWNGLERSECRGQRSGEPNSRNSRTAFNAKGATKRKDARILGGGAAGRGRSSFTPAQGRWMAGRGRNSQQPHGRARTGTDRKRGTKDFFVCGGCVGGFWGFS